MSNTADGKILRRWFSAVTTGAFLMAMLIISATANAHVIPRPCDFVTGGGFVVKSSGAKANFGLVAGCKHHAFRGHVNFVDHGTGLHVRSTSITGYTAVKQGTLRRDICGRATTNLFGSLRFHVVVVDNGEPGTRDRFGIALSNGYILTTRTLGGGNIQLHKPNRSTTPPPTFTECSSVAPDPGP
jgi:hypothetical protein